ncbi:SAM-dependent methyltransferase [Colwellia psychrerythraea]|uniref:Uroporphyrin-III C/tetrapyrrole (Corrin/Porphyrin) methyltransferase n=1 Tax=Colwellia psychrerythraea TaxID=28229 RepID=A0A099KJD8_COLPS|nr:SAM-dependent methyltransferase [Colwellia psychrerythraea]KGJ89688.1 Uroporphyrin-III C/tetrapyrrole (Corrin/Porphyrin) methyltransferase [Colwellia psychrerythraea]
MVNKAQNSANLDSSKAGSLVCVGTGIALAGQITTIAKSHIENADVVFAALPNSIADQWLASLNPNIINLQQFYVDGMPRTECYQNMVNAILTEVRTGKNVVGAFYGHAGVFAWAPHESIRIARSEGYSAYMEPGISAEDCLYADLGIDPGTVGCQAFETSQLLFYKHTVDPASLLILWQIGIAGDHTFTTYDSDINKLELTVQFLNQWYDNDHEVIVYEAPFLPTQTVRMDRIKLKDLAKCKLSMISTLVIPPAKKLELDHETLAMFGLKAADLTSHQEKRTEITEVN